jgi:hypothetical protein
MLIEAVQHHLERRRNGRGLKCSIRTGATDADIADVELKLGVQFPEQVVRFYRYYDGIRVEHPSLEIRPLHNIAFVSPSRLHFATVNNDRPLCFDTTCLNDAGQWDIIDCRSSVVVTLTMASFWSNRIWAWIDHRRRIWLPYDERESVEPEKPRGTNERS